MSYLSLSLLGGFASGLRALIALAALSWASRLGYVQLQGSPLVILGYALTPYLLTLAALGELVNDKLAKTPSRRVPPQFITRILTGSLSGAAIAIGHRQSSLLGLVAGLTGSVAGTLIGSKLRATLVRLIGRDLPAALVEDLMAIAVALLATLA